MTDDRARENDWDRTQWEGEGQGDRHVDDPAGIDGPAADRWTKTQWVGEGQGDAGPSDPDTMAEGEHRLSGDRHTPGEEHWAERER